MIQWHAMSRLKGRKKVDVHLPGSSEEGAKDTLRRILFAAGECPPREYWIEPVEYAVAEPRKRRSS